ncbi:hypothetical protein BHE74_00057953 [Ensete ventricosum]|nr:hypothetical protein BHE74_00057953 [Ensete ventricosum]
MERELKFSQGKKLCLCQKKQWELPKKLLSAGRYTLLAAALLTHAAKQQRCAAADKPLAAKQLTHAAKQPPSCAASAATQQHCRVTLVVTCLCVYMASAASGLSACVSAGRQAIT